MAAAPEHAVGIAVPHFGVARLRLMDPTRATAAGGSWLFAGLSDQQVVPVSSSD
jgi:hypothetical protein